jgi:hypothetical protein
LPELGAHHILHIGRIRVNAVAVDKGRFIPIILANLNPIYHLPELGAHHILHIGRIRVNAVAVDKG